jgi:hypothetical protein
MVWVYRNRQRVVAHQGAIPVKVKIDAAERVTGWFVETMAADDVRGKGIGPMLIKKALEDSPFTLSLGQTPQMRALQFAMGWKQVAPLDTLAYIVNPARALRNRVPNPILRRAAGAGLRARQWWARAWHRPAARVNADVRPVSRFDDRHDELWEQVKGSYRCAVVRDSSYLNWKYVDQPGQQYLRLEARASGQLLWVVVLLVCEPDSLYPYRRAFVADLVAPLDEPDVLAAALSAVRKTCIEREVDVILCELLSRNLSRAMANFGFARLEPQRFFLVSVPEDAALGQAALAADNWFVISGDSDIDRPW